MTDTTTDAQLVAAHLAGDRGAFAAMYDRYGGTLYDTAAAMTRDRHDAADITQDVFVIAAERLAQLRDPSRLKPWLFAILRNEVYRRTGKRKRTVLTDFTEPVAEMALPSDAAEEAAAVEYQELAELVRGASAGLDERDQLVLELSIRQGLDGDDLADALGVTPQQSYNLVHRMRQRTERSLGAFCVARMGRKDCRELAELLQGWDGEFSVLIRKRVARHIDGCEVCERSRRTIAPLALFGAAPAFAAPADLRDRVLGAVGRGADPTYAFSAPGGFPVLTTARRLGLWIVLSTLALLFVGGAAAYVFATDGDDGELTIVDASTTTVTDGVAAATTVPSGTTDPSTTSAGATTTSTSSSTTSSSTSTSSTSTTSSTSSTSSTSTTEPLVVTLPPTTTTTVAPTTSTTTSTTSTTTSTSTTTTSSTTPVSPGDLTLSSGSVDFGTTLDQARVTLANTGGQAVDWVVGSGPATFRGGASPFSASPAAGSLAPGQAVDITISFDRAWPTEGPIATRRFTFAAAGTAAVVDVDGEIARVPTVRPTSPPATICARGPAGNVNPLIATATVRDESRLTRVTFTAVNPQGVDTTIALGPGRTADSWTGTAVTDLDGDGEPESGLWTWTISATDEFGNVGSASGSTEIFPTFC